MTSVKKVKQSNFVLETNHASWFSKI